MSQEIRKQIKAAGLKQWEVAQELNISEGTLIRWLRGTPSKKHEAMILAAIDLLKESREE